MVSTPRLINCCSLSDKCIHGQVQHQVCIFFKIHIKEITYLVLYLSMSTSIRQDQQLKMMKQAYRHDTEISTRVVGEAKLPGLNSSIVFTSCKQ